MFLPSCNNILDSTIVDILLRKIQQDMLAEQLESVKVLCGIATGQLDEKKDAGCHGECLA